jgi:hypothetical protein
MQKMTLQWKPWLDSKANISKFRGQFLIHLPENQIKFQDLLCVFYSHRTFSLAGSIDSKDAKWTC